MKQSPQKHRLKFPCPRFSPVLQRHTALRPKHIHRFPGLNVIAGKVVANPLLLDLAAAVNRLEKVGNPALGADLLPQRIERAGQRFCIVDGTSVLKQERTVPPGFSAGRKPQNRQTALRPDIPTAEILRCKLRRQLQPSGDPIEVISGKNNILPPPAAVAASPACKGKSFLPSKVRQSAVPLKIHPSAEVHLTILHLPAQLSFHRVSSFSSSSCRSTSSFRFKKSRKI